MSKDLVSKDVVKKPRLVIASDNFLPRRDGVTSFLKEVIPRLKDTFELSVICPDYGTEDVSFEGVNFIRIPLSRFSAGDFKLPKFKPRKIFKALKSADIVFTQTIGPIGATTLFLAQRMRKKSVSFIHSIEWDLVAQSSDVSFIKKYSYPITKCIAHFLYSRCSYLIVPSESVGDILTWKDFKTAKKIINLGVNTNKFTPFENVDLRSSRRESLGIKDGDFVLGYHGRIAREKDLLTLVRAFVKLRRQYSNLKLLIVGSGLKSVERQLECQPGVIHVPAVSDPQNYLQLMDIYCLSSLTETTSLSVLEAMSCGLPVVTSRVGFVKDYINHRYNGLFFEKGDSFSLSKEINRLLRSSDLRKKLGVNARHTVVHHFDWDLTGMKLIDFFERNFK